MNARKRTGNRAAAAGCVLVLVASLTGAGQGSPQAAVLRFSNAPITLEYPETWRDWAISLGAYADASAENLEQILGTPIPAGTIRW